MARIQTVDDEHAAIALADLLNGNTRRRPVVVVTIPAGASTPWIDVEEIAREAGDLAGVYLMPTGDLTWAFSRKMADGTQVYGGAGRVYPVGHQWNTDLTKSPLRFAFDARDGERATDQLISDTLRMAAAAGLVQARPQQALRQVSGRVKMVVARRALVDIGNAMPAAIVEELTVEDVSIERIVGKDQHITGWFDPASNRVDVTKSLRPANDALAGYSVGDIVLAKAVMVRNGKADLLLYPKTTTPEVKVPVLRKDVTTNPLDDLRTLMSVGEVIAARVVSTGPDWSLVLNDVDDDEYVLDAPALLPGGPPWISEDLEPADEERPELILPAPPAPVAPLQIVAEPPETEPSPPAPPTPSPALLDRKRPRLDSPAPRPSPAAAFEPPPSATPSRSTKELLLKIDGLGAEVATLQRQVEEAQTQVQASTDERHQLRYLVDQAERRANKAEHGLRAAKARLRKTGNARAQAEAASAPRFADREQGFRYLVLTSWATRTSPAEQADRPLPDYLIGPKFLETLDALEGIKEQKVADVVFEIVTGLAPTVQGRQLHQLRTGSGGDDPILVRADGAVAWRASLQVKSPSARRIHFWVLPDGRIELARVATHDDFDA